MTRKPKKNKTVTWEKYFESVKKQLGKKEFDKWFETNKDNFNSINPKQKITFDDSGDREAILNAQKNAEKGQKEFNELIKGYEPYDLSEITKIYHKAEEDSKQIKNRETILKFFTLVLDEIDSIIKNAKNCYDFLEEKGYLSIAPSDFWREVEQAETTRDNLKKKIGKLQFPEIEGFDVSYKPEIKENPSPTVKTSISEQKSYPEIMTVNQVTEYLGFSLRKINGMVQKKEIPCQKIKRNNRFDKTEIDEWRKTGKMPERYNPQETSEKKEGKTIHFTFIIDLKPLTNMLFDNGYLNKDNAILMNDRFSKESKHKSKHIYWNKDLRSLITFIYLLDRLEYFEKSNLRTTREHNTSVIEKKENTNEKKEIRYQVLLKNYFIIHDDYSYDKAMDLPPLGTQS